MKHVKTDDLNKIKQDYNLISKALPCLADIGASITCIRFRSDSQPTQIEIEHTKAVNKLPSAFSTGRGLNNQGQQYISKAAVFCGVLVTWAELH